MSPTFRPSRRTFLRHGGMAAAGLAAAGSAAGSAAQAHAMRAEKPHARQYTALDPSTLAPFVDPLVMPARALPQGTRPDPEHPSQTLPFFRIAAREIRVKIHRDLPPTRMWSFGDSFPGPTIEARAGQGIMVEWANQLPPHHLLPIDHTLHGAERSVPDVRTVVHLHGGRTPASSDGYPEDWTTPGKSQVCHYPCGQSAATLFYHDHTMGINRLNTYAGLQGFFLLRDPREDSLGLPSGEHDIPLMFTDRLLTTVAQLLYTVSENPERPWVPEVFGDCILVNGKLLPFHAVQPRKYRLRLMNGSNGRFYRFSLANKASFQVIANDQGLLAAPVTAKRISLAPAERADIVVDFASLAGATVNLVSDSFDLLQFRVAAHGSPDTSRVPTVLAEDAAPTASTAVRTRRLTLDENMDDIQRSMGMLLNNTPWHAPVTEKPVLNTTEIWELVNLTDDSHPIHLHLVRFRILDRRPIDKFACQATGTVRFTGPAQPPDAYEAGWKDTVRADPGAITRILVPFTRYTGRYVWHCHILEHEDNEMMRPFEVVPA